MTTSCASAASKLSSAKGERLGGRLHDLRTGDALARGGGERLGRFGAGDVLGAEDPGQHGRQPARPAADVEHAACRARRAANAISSAASGVL